MLEYLLSKAQKAGLEAWKYGNAIQVKFSFKIIGKVDSFTVVTIRNIDDFNVFIGNGGRAI